VVRLPVVPLPQLLVEPIVLAVAVEAAVGGVDVVVAHVDDDKHAAALLLLEVVVLLLLLVRSAWEGAVAKRGCCWEELLLLEGRPH